MRRSDIAQVTLDIQATFLALAAPCTCGRPHCPIGEHIYDSTRNMTPGPRARSFEPSTAGNGHHDGDPPPDPTTNIHDTYQAKLHAAQRACLDLYRCIADLRPDRHIPLPDPTTDNNWCRNHLNRIGTCEPRYRGDLCSDCYELKLMYGTAPDAQCLRAISDTGYKAARIINDWAERMPNKSVARKRRERERERKRTQAVAGTH